ncbi:hypothetical protein EDC01DRAFT_719646 [Geopyxis carbonaria]|nr:hypothetical protein EDC01DRAFT_719646 [Geopyxis carbonaria]
MPTNRPFLANLLVAFRAHNATTKAQPSSHDNPPASKGPNKPASASTSATASAAAAAAAAAASSQTQTQTQAQTQAQTQPMFTSSRGRRSSSSSTEGFVEPPSGEKWWIGGRNSDGQERFYRLQPVRRHRSYDRLSVDRMSL